jgi:hypothetical protein
VHHFSSLGEEPMLGPSQQVLTWSSKALGSLKLGTPKAAPDKARENLNILDRQVRLGQSYLYLGPSSRLLVRERRGV